MGHLFFDSSLQYHLSYCASDSRRCQVPSSFFSFEKLQGLRIIIEIMGFSIIQAHNRYPLFKCNSFLLQQAFDLLT